MAKRMLIDATHAEETRVVVHNGNRLEEFDFESSTKKQVKGNIYLAKVTRVEPSLQAAFVDYGSNRHGFLAFSEIHSDYYKIPVGDREAPDVAGDAEPAPQDSETRESEPENTDIAGIPLAAALPEPIPVPARPEAGEDDVAEAEPSEQSDLAADGTGPVATPPLEDAYPGESRPVDAYPAATLTEPLWGEVASVPEIVANPIETTADPYSDTSSVVAAASAGLDEAITPTDEFPAVSSEGDAAVEVTAKAPDGGADAGGPAEEGEVIETLGGDELEEAEHQRSRTIRHYKIQEVIKRRQIMLVQVSKEERGNKGAALTTYLSLAGRYCVLMPNTARGGGVSRKITSISDRRRLKDILEELEIPEGMGVIVRTAGAERSKAEIKRDYEYLLRLWNEIRDLTLRSTAPALIYEEGSLIKRSIRDLYTRDIDEVLVEGEDGYRTAKTFMKMLMPSHAKRVQPYRDPQIGLFHRFQVESQIDAIHSPIVQLRSGGYVVINQTEALVAIDVNSGRSTRERNIEETALRTNLEAAEEIARQLRLRDLAGLIVIDFIDMEEHRNHGAVERRLKDALKNDRARIQVGRISPFGLLEMSRQRLRPSLVETSTQPCPHCGGSGSIRSTESTALYVLRSIEEEGMRRRSAEICVYVPTAVALYILNQKRDSLVQLEARYGVRVLLAQDDALIPPAFRLERLRAYGPTEAAISPMAPLTQSTMLEEEEEEDEAPLEAPETGQEDQEERGRSRRRRRRRRRHDEAPTAHAATASSDTIDGPEEVDGEFTAANRRADGDDEDTAGDDNADRRRRRGRRGGRRRAKRENDFEGGLEEPRPASDTVEILPTPVAEEAEPALVEAHTNWPVEVGATAIEAASLPALAGDAPSVAAPPASRPNTEGPAADQTSGRDASTVESEQGAPYVSVAERSLETAVAASEREPTNPVQTVTEKPANPRRGWWQRLIQS